MIDPVGQYLPDWLTLEGADVMLSPGGFMLTHTAESIMLPGDICGQVGGKSSLGRLGLAVHVTAGFVDPGWSGQLTLELTNLSGHPFILRAGMPIAQIKFRQLSSPAEQPYGSKGLGSKYQGSAGVVGSRYGGEYQ